MTTKIGNREVEFYTVYDNEVKYYNKLKKLMARLLCIRTNKETFPHIKDVKFAVGVGASYAFPAETVILVHYFVNSIDESERHHKINVGEIVLAPAGVVT